MARSTARTGSLFIILLSRSRGRSTTRGETAQLKYRSDRYVTCALAREGVNSIYQKGLYEYLAEIQVVMVTHRPFAESTTLTTATGSRTNNSALQSITPGGNYPTNPIFTFVAGTWNFSNDLRVDNNANSMYFGYSGAILAGQTLVVDCDAGCVLLQVGLTMVDSISLFFGNLFFELKDSLQNDMPINAATLSYSIAFRDRYYS